MPIKTLFSSYLISLSILVFTPRSQSSSKFLGLVEIPWIAEKFLNLFLLMPLFYFVYRIFPRINLFRILLFCSTISVFIELIQVFIPGRIPDIYDVLTNSLGALIIMIHIKKSESEQLNYGKKVKIANSRELHE